MDQVTCLVQLAGDHRTQVYLGPNRLVTYPEVAVLRAIHGHNAVTKIQVVGTLDGTAQEEKARLAGIYGPLVIEQVFPGVNPQMPLEAGGDTGEPERDEPLNVAPRKSRAKAAAAEI